MANYLDIVVSAIVATSTVGTGVTASALTDGLVDGVFSPSLPSDRVAYSNVACPPADRETAERALDALGGSAELLGLAARSGAIAAAVVPPGSACFLLPEDASMPGRQTRIFVAPDGKTFLSLGGQTLAL